MHFDKENNFLIEEKELVLLFIKALKKLYAMDAEIFEVDAQERAVAARLAMYLREQFLPAEEGGLRIDVEYNRDGDEIKRPSNEVDSGWIAPDIILHQRKSGNLKGDERYKNDIFYCEIKKASRTGQDDAEKVKKQMVQRKYRYGIDLYKLSRSGAKFDVYIYDHRKISGPQNHTVNFEEKV